VALGDPTRGAGAVEAAVDLVGAVAAERAGGAGLEGPTVGPNQQVAHKIETIDPIKA
jgi:hypothetical protein